MKNSFKLLILLALFFSLNCFATEDATIKYVININNVEAAYVSTVIRTCDWYDTNREHCGIAKTPQYPPGNESHIYHYRTMGNISGAYIEQVVLHRANGTMKIYKFNINSCGVENPSEITGFFMSAKINITTTGATCAVAYYPDLKKAKKS